MKQMLPQYHPQPNSRFRPEVQHRSERAPQPKAMILKLESPITLQPMKPPVKCASRLLLFASCWESERCRMACVDMVQIRANLGRGPFELSQNWGLFGVVAARFGYLL